MVVTQKQKGITLLLAVIVLATITAITFSIAGIILSEVRTANDLSSTEPVLYTTQSFLELALFKVSNALPETQNLPGSSNSRDALSLDPATQFTFGTPACDPNTIICKAAPHDNPADVSQSSKFNNVQTESVVKSLNNDDIIYDTIICYTTTYCADINAYEIYDSTNPTKYDSGYNKIEVYNQGPDQIDALLCKTSDILMAECTDTAFIAPAGTRDLRTAQGVSGANTPITFCALPAGRYSLYLRKSAANRQARVLIKAYTGSTCTFGTGTIKGLPLVGSVRVLINATAKGVYRTYQAIIPK
ncbi:MAG TPA: hypothetical protein VEA59_04260 [Patescibacteria group bacterium]|nr:hypothetical protein [Patescibacteria group bacterium]